MLNNSGVYQIRNRVNGKVYVGSSANMRKRRNTHFSDLRRGIHSNTHLQRAFNKYGEDSFIFEVLEICSVEDLEERETWWIRSKNANNREYGYNSRLRVDSNRGFRHTEETKRKISVNRRGKGTGKRDLPKEVREFLRQKCIEQNLAQYHTKETEEKRLTKLREVVKGKPISDDHKMCISRKNRGEGNGKAKLTEREVVEIKRLLAEGNLTQTDIAKRFGVSRRAVGLIKTGERWGHVKVS